MAKLFDLSSLSFGELLIWLKDPINIFAGNVIGPTGPYYSNIFSQYELYPTTLLENTTFTNISILDGKRIGYITPSQKRLAEILSNLLGKCRNIAFRHIQLFGEPYDVATTIGRIWKGYLISEILKDYTSLDNGRQCITADSNIKIIKDIASGCFGTVHLAELGKEKYTLAVKKTIEGMNKTSVIHAYDTKYEAWDEINFLRPYINSLVQKGICQNVPYIYANLICNTCNFNIPKSGGCKEINKKNVPCNTILMELSNGTLKDWKIGSLQEQYACLFQCAAGLHAIQRYFQMENGDVKSANILYTKCIPGGYWEYVIFGKSYYIPNFGDIFTINDYGIGKSYDLSLPICKKLELKDKRTTTRSADYRPFIVVNDAFTIINYGMQPNFIAKRYFGQLFPLVVLKEGNKTTEASQNGEGLFSTYTASLSADQTKSLRDNHLPANPNNPDFFSNSSVVPYLNMYVDTQDLIRTFVGDVERTTQSGIHGPLDIDDSIKYKLEPYVFPIKNLTNKFTSPTFMTPQNSMAGYFIKDFFGDMFSVKPGGPLLQRFVI